MADGNITVEVSTQAAQAELARLRAENAALKREAHTWWAAARDAAKVERARCALRVALHSQYPIETDYDRGYDKARKDAAETLRTMGDDAGLALGPNGRGEPPKVGCTEVLGACRCYKKVLACRRLRYYINTTAARSAATHRRAP